MRLVFALAVLASTAASQPLAGVMPGPGGTHVVTVDPADGVPTTRAALVLVGSDESPPGVYVDAARGRAYATR